MPVLRSALIALSQNRPLRRLMEDSRLGRKLSSRFVAGMDILDALAVAEKMQRQEIACTLDALGESISTEAEARRAAGVYHELLDMLAVRKLNANVSLKLTQMGLGLSVDLAEEIVGGLVEHAASLGNFVRVDMEDSALTQITIDLVRRLHARPALRNSVGIVLQAYLYRTAEDVELLLQEGIRIRLCKGAYKEPASVAFPRKADVDANYIRLSQRLLASPHYHGLATHDLQMIEAARQFAREQKIQPDRFEFQMLYGVRRDLQRHLVEEGYTVRLYIPFGRQWYPYFMRRLAERPANLLFLLKNMLR